MKVMLHRSACLTCRQRSTLMATASSYSVSRHHRSSMNSDLHISVPSRVAYVIGWMQYVRCGSVRSSVVAFHCCVQQGSVVGPSLFKLHLTLLKCPFVLDNKQIFGPCISSGMNNFYKYCVPWRICMKWQTDSSHAYMTDSIWCSTLSCHIQ